MNKIVIAKAQVYRAMRGRYSTFGALADAAGISTTTMTKTVDSYNWKSKTLFALAEALDVEPMTLLEEIPEQNT